MPFSAKLCALTLLGSIIITACTANKLEARLEANPQCKEVINPKTGATMPCPGSDKSFYRSAGLESNKVAAPDTATGAAVVITSDAASTSAPRKLSTPASPQSNCKPQIHQKTGGILPCPAPD